jgi:acyl-CoA synthetase (AMP-forming)/AMP-acid ligase II
MTTPQPWRSDLPAVDDRAVGVPEFLFEHAARFGDKPALVDGPTGRTLSYRQLAGAVERVAAGLAARGFAKGDVLALSSPPTCPSTRWPCTAPWPPGASSPAPTRC